MHSATAGLFVKFEVAGGFVAAPEADRSLGATAASYAVLSTASEHNFCKGEDEHNHIAPSLLSSKRLFQPSSVRWVDGLNDENLAASEGKGVLDAVIPFEQANSCGHCRAFPNEVDAVCQV